MKTKVFFIVLSILSAEILSAQNPKLIDDIYPGSFSSYLGDLVVFNNKLYFSARDIIHGTELVEFDGTNEPVFYDLVAGEGSSNPKSLCVFNNKLYFSANDCCHGAELWSFDGINQPTMEYDILAGRLGSDPGQLIVFKNRLFFLANDNIYGAELWSYDGTNPPEMVYDIWEGSSYSVPQYLTILNDKLYFTADNGVDGRQLWEYDGTSIPLEVSNIPGLNPLNLCAFNNELYFSGQNEQGDEFWNYDGTGQPHLEADIYPGFKTYFDPLSGYYNQRPNSSQPSSLFVFNDKLFFSACDSIHGCELWALDELSNLSLIVDINPGDQSSAPSQFSIYNNNLYFSASDGLHPKLLWVFDGIQNPRIAGDTGNLATYPHDLTAFNNLLYFSADDYSTFGRELWAYDELLTNVSDAIVENKIAIFPIPTKDVVNIVLSGFDNKNIILEICNIQGQTLEFLPLNSINLNSLRVDLSNYSNGIYFAKIRNENFIKVVKVVKN